MMNRLLKQIFAILLFAALTMPISVASDNGLADGDHLEESEGHYIPGYGTIAYKIDLNANPEEIQANGISTSTIKAQLTDKKGRNINIANININFEANKGTLSASNADTDSNGIATVTLTSGTKAGTSTIKAESDSVLMRGMTHVKFTKANPKDDKDKKDNDKKDNDKKDKDEDKKSYLDFFVR